MYWRNTRATGDSLLVFSGGLPTDVTGVTPSLTILQGKSPSSSPAGVLEFDNNVLDFFLVTDSPWPSDYQEPEAAIVVLPNDLVAVDCRSGNKSLRNPYAMDFNDSPVTCCR